MPCTSKIDEKVENDTEMIINERRIAVRESIRKKRRMCGETIHGFRTKITYLHTLQCFFVNFYQETALLMISLLPYLPDMAPYVFFMFLNGKRILKGVRFISLG